MYIAHLDSINGIHDRMLLLDDQSHPVSLLSFVFGELTAMPAKAPAVIFCSNEKLGGSPS
jgi:hypothetical protein